MSGDMFVCTQAHCRMEFTDLEGFIVHSNAHNSVFNAALKEENVVISDDVIPDQKPSLDTIGHAEILMDVSVKEEPQDNYGNTENIIEIKPMECDENVLDIVPSVCNPEIDVKIENVAHSLSNVTGPFFIDFSKNIHEPKDLRPGGDGGDFGKRPVLCTAREMTIRSPKNEVLCTLSIEENFRQILDQETKQRITSNDTDDNCQSLYSLETSTSATGQREYSLVRNSGVVNTQPAVKKISECTLCHMTIMSDKCSAEMHMYRFHLLEYIEAMINDNISKNSGVEIRKIVQIVKGADKLENKEQRNLYHKPKNIQDTIVKLEGDNTETITEKSKPVPFGTCNIQTELDLNNSRIPQTFPTAKEMKHRTETMLDIDPLLKPATSDHLSLESPPETGTKYSCDFCDKSFKKKSLLIVHSRHHSEENWFQCEHCDEKFKYKHHFLNHLSSHKPDADRPFKCSECGEGFLFQTLLTIHSHTHKTPVKRIRSKKAAPKCKSFTCNICDQTFKQKSLLIIHSRHHSEENWFQCEHCDEKFKYKKTFLSHVSQHKPDAERPFKCSECGEGFMFKSLLTIHRHKHKDHECQICGKTFTTKEYLKVHEREHTGEKPLQCDLCGQCFSQSSGLYTHKKNNHSEPTHKCDFCGKAYGTRQGLEIHRRIHTGELPFQCEHCDRAFRHKSSLRVHRMSHTRIRKIPHLEEHQKKKQKELIHKCEFCDKAYGSRQGLRVHRRKHTGELPFQCEFCDRAFRYRASRKIHHESHARKKKVSDFVSKLQE